MVAIRTPLNLLTYAACLLGTAPLFPSLEWPARLLAPAALAIGAWCDRRERYFLGRHAATVLSFALFAGYALRISRSVLVEPVVNILVLLLAVRLVTEKSGRNYLQIFVLTLFALAGSSLLSLSPLFLPVLVLLVLCVTVGLVLLTFHTSQPRLALPRRQLAHLLGTALVLPVGSLLLMLVFFFILPRTQFPLWDFLNPGATAASGFSETVQPGAFAANAAVTDLAFRAQCEELPEGQVYWRGIVLNTLEGQRWVRRPPPTGEGVRISGGRQVPQTLYPEPGATGYLFALDPPRSFAGIRSRGSADLVHTARLRPGKRASYQAVSAVGGHLEATGQLNREFYLATPAATSSRLRALAKRLANGAGGDRGRITRTEDFFREQRLTYATTDLPGPEAPIDEFLFGKKRGYCEFFASAFAVLLRLEGIPARLVGGYLGGTYNALGGYYSVTENSAHVWVEALVDGRWLRIDPSRLAANAASTLLEPGRRQLGWGRRLADALDYFWNQAVITYDLGRQLALLRRAGGGLQALRPHWPTPGNLLWLGGGGLLLAVGAWLLFRMGTPVEKRLCKKFLRLARQRLAGEELPDSLGLEDLARRLEDPCALTFVRIYQGAVFRDRRLSPAEKHRLETLLKTLAGNRSQEKAAADSSGE